MIPLERWNVERECNFCGKSTMTWLIQPIVRTSIRPLERKVGRRDAKLERSDNRWSRLGRATVLARQGEEKPTQLAPPVSARCGSGLAKDACIKGMLSR